MLGFSVCCEVVNGSCPPLALLTVPSQEKGKEWLAAHSANCTTRSLYLSEAELSGAPPRKLVISCPAEEGRAGCGGRQITTCRRSLRKKEGRREGEEAEKDGRWERRGLAARGAVADLEGSSGSPWRLTLLQTNRFYLFILIISSLLFSTWYSLQTTSPQLVSATAFGSSGALQLHWRCPFNHPRH